MQASFDGAALALGSPAAVSRQPRLFAADGRSCGGYPFSPASPRASFPSPAASALLRSAIYAENITCRSLPNSSRAMATAARRESQQSGGAR